MHYFTSYSYLSAFLTGKISDFKEKNKKTVIAGLPQ